MPERWPVWVLLGQLLVACSGDPGTGPREVKWDRFTCERCRMVLSDRQHAAQVRSPRPDGGSEVRFFDDLGCALIWLQGKVWKDDPRTEIWVTDWRDGAWIDARSAHYVPGQHTPMAYGLGAQGEPAGGALSFAEARVQVLRAEADLKAHLQHPAP